MAGPISFVVLDHLVLRVRNLALMEDFYTQVLGMVVERRLDDLGLVQLRAGDSLLDLVPVDKPLGAQGGPPPGEGGRNVDHFCWRLDSFEPEQIYAHLRAHGISADSVQRRYGAEGFGPSIYLKDPEGNVLELKGPAESGSVIN